MPGYILIILIFNDKLLPNFQHRLRSSDSYRVSSLGKAMHLVNVFRLMYCAPVLTACPISFQNIGAASTAEFFQVQVSFKLCVNRGKEKQGEGGSLYPYRVKTDPTFSEPAILKASPACMAADIIKLPPSKVPLSLREITK